MTLISNFNNLFKEINKNYPKFDYIYNKDHNLTEFYFKERVVPV